MCECSMHTSHPHGTMALQYGGIPCVYGRIPVVYGRILRVYRRIPQVYGHLRADTFRLYGRTLGGVRPYTHSICCQSQCISTSCLLEFHRFFLCTPTTILGHSLRSITYFEVAETGVELVPPRGAAGQVVSSRGFTELVAIGRGDAASAPSHLACTTGKDIGYYS